MNQRLRLTSSVIASSFALIALAGLHEACTGVVLTTNVTDAGATPDSSFVDAHVNPDSSPPTGDSGGTIPEGGPEGGPSGCSTLAGKLARWSVMDESPFAPWNMAGLAIGSMEAGITLSEAESINCIGTPIPLLSSPDAGTPDGGVCDMCGHCYAEIAWGTSQEVDFEYDTTTNVVAQVVLNMGYTGAADFWSDPNSKLDPPGTGGGTTSVGPGETKPSNHYHMAIGQQIQKNAQPFELNWDDPEIASHMMIYNAMMYFYGSPLGIYPGGDSIDCEDEQTCLFYPPEYASSDNNLCIFGIRPMRLYLETDCGTELQPGVSTLAQVYQDGESTDYKLGVEIVDGGYVMNDAGGYVYTCDAAVPY
jgi:hypothetical protein